MSTPENPEPPAEPKAAGPARYPVMLARIGNIQGFVEMHGEGISQQPTVRISKLVSADVAKANPQAAHTYNMEEVAAIKALCDCLLREAYTMQSLILQPTPRPVGTVEKLSEEPA